MDAKLLDQLRQQRDAIDTAIRVLETMRIANAVTQGATGFISVPAANGRPRQRRKQIRDPFTDRPFPEDVALIVRGAKAPIKTPELTSILEADGVAIPHGGVPKRRYVGMVAARLAKLGRVKKTAARWTRGKD